jgi:hypothetical protein
MAKGGRRQGAGRPKGRRNNRTLELGALLDELVPNEKHIRLLKEIAQGKRRRVLDRNGRLVTVQDPPDGATARYLGDRKWGRAPIAVHGDPEESPVRVVVIDKNRFGVVT